MSSEQSEMPRHQVKEAYLDHLVRRFQQLIEVSGDLALPKATTTFLGCRKSLSIAKNHLKPSQEFSEQFGPSIHKIKGFGRNSPPKVHPNFAQKLGRQIIENTFSGLNFCTINIQTPLSTSVCKSKKSMSVESLLIAKLVSKDFACYCCSGLLRDSGSLASHTRISEIDLPDARCAGIVGSLARIAVLQKSKKPRIRPAPLDTQ